MKENTESHRKGLSDQILVAVFISTTRQKKSLDFLE